MSLRTTTICIRYIKRLKLCSIFLLFAVLVTCECGKLIRKKKKFLDFVKSLSELFDLIKRQMQGKFISNKTYYLSTMSRP